MPGDLRIPQSAGQHSGLINMTKDLTTDYSGRIEAGYSSVYNGAEPDEGSRLRQRTAERHVRDTRERVQTPGPRLYR